MTATEAYNSHLSACVICQRQQAPTGSGRCSYGFRSFLDFSAEIWAKAKEVRFISGYASGSSGTAPSAGPLPDTSG